MKSVQIVASVILAAWLVGGCVTAILNHGKPLGGRANCRPVIYVAVIEAILIFIAIWA